MHDMACELCVQLGSISRLILFLLSFSQMVLPVTRVLVIALVLWVVPVVMEVVLVDQEAVGAHQNLVFVR